MSITAIVVILLILILIGILPTWPHAQQFGWNPAGIIALIVIVILIFKLLDRI